LSLAFAGVMVLLGLVFRNSNIALIFFILGFVGLLAISLVRTKL